MLARLLRSYRFFGGVHPPDNKDLSLKASLQRLPLAPRLYLPLQQHVGEAARVCVEVNETVTKGQLLAEPASAVSAAVHAPSNGIVEAIEDHPVPHPSGLRAPCIVLRVLRERPMPGFDQLDAEADALSDAQIKDRIREAGIVGLGGATFPSAIKLTPRPDKPVETLIINGAECEPYITCDDVLMQTRATTILRGVRLLRRVLQTGQCILALEDNKSHARAVLAEALAALPETERDGIEIRVVPTVYPTGGEKQLIKAVTGREVPRGRLPADIGVVCHNVGTVNAIAEAIYYHKPLLERIVTVTGEAVAKPGNYIVPLGTPIEFIIDVCGGYTSDNPRLTMGGPMMGFRLASDALPVVKGTNCILVQPSSRSKKSSKVMPCIRCGQCARVCPMQLLPQQLYRYARAQAFNKVETFNLFDCIECGCCDYVCPSNIPLVDYYRYAKTEIRAQRREKEKAEQSRQRHEMRQQRLAAEQAQKAAKQRRRKRPAGKAGEDDVQEASS